MATVIHSSTRSPPLFTGPLVSPWFPIEVCERIIDFVARSFTNEHGERENSRSPLTRCAQVCRAWVPRCRFHLSSDTVTLRSRKGVPSFSLFLSVFPHAVSTLNHLRIYGRTGDSWMYSVPAILPPLPKLIHLSIHDVDLAHQHTTLYKLYSTFNLAKPNLHLIRVSFHHFTQVSRLVLATGARELDMTDCPLSPPMPKRTGLGRLLPHNVLLGSIKFYSATWTNLLSAILFGSDWFLSCPNLEYLYFQLDTTEASQLETPPPFSLEHAHAWSRLYDLFWRLHSRSVQLKEGIRLTMALGLFIELRGGVAGKNPKLILQCYNPIEDTDTRASFVSGVLQALPVLCSGGFSTVSIVADMEWFWEDGTPEIWNPVDDALSHYYPFLTHFKLCLPTEIPYHDVFTPQYGCVENLTRAFFPRTAQTATIKKGCVGDNCGIHESIQWRQRELETRQQKARAA